MTSVARGPYQTNPSSTFFAGQGGVVIIVPAVITLTTGATQPTIAPSTSSTVDFPQGLYRRIANGSEPIDFTRVGRPSTVSPVSGGGVTIASTLPSTTGTVGDLLSTTSVTEYQTSAGRVSARWTLGGVAAHLSGLSTARVEFNALIPTTQTGTTVEWAINGNFVTWTAAADDQDNLRNFAAAYETYIRTLPVYSTTLGGTSPVWTVEVNAEADGSIDVILTSVADGAYVRNPSTEPGSNGAIWITQGGITLPDIPMNINTGTAAPIITPAAPTHVTYPQGLFRRIANSGTPLDFTEVDAENHVTFSTVEDSGESDNHIYRNITINVIVRFP